MVREKSAGAIIYRTEEEPLFLLLHYAAGHWDLPKGHIEKDETEKQTVKREVKEETGLTDLEFIDGFREVISYHFRRKKQTVYKDVIFYLVKTKEKKVMLSHEHIGYEWLNYKDALERLTFRNAKQILEKSNALIKK